MCIFVDKRRQLCLCLEGKVADRVLRDRGIMNAGDTVELRPHCHELFVEGLLTVLRAVVAWNSVHEVAGDGALVQF